MELVSELERRDITVRDCIRFHHFKAGLCSCGGYWDVPEKEETAAVTAVGVISKESSCCSNPSWTWRSSQASKPALALDYHVPMKNSQFVVHGNHIYQFAGVHWQNNDEGKHDFKVDDGGDTDVLVESADGVINQIEPEGELNEFLKDLDLE
ncbi:hypothetical protein IFM89_028258 [Coptis chinensis]|uniref:DYW domain-containing protein n=1 Tax=Coptis chinensis TaxID=261450 RepID=A0A835M779_9MAGN|nr:hypothetical protein IFM89_028258 [Coptis chinensis]